MSSVKNAQLPRRAQRKPPRAIAIPISKAVGEAAAAEAASAQEPLFELRGRGKLIEPPFELAVLASMGENNSELGQVVEAMETNVVGFGWSLDPIAEAGVTKVEPSAEEEKEWETYHKFLEYGNWDEGSKSLTYHLRQQRKDYELTGMSFREIILNAKLQPVGYVHAPAHRMRLTITDEDFTSFQEVVVVGRGKSRRMDTVWKRRRFRRYVQIDPTRNKLVYFKEFDDPRPISRVTGEVLSGSEALNHGLLANPMVFRRNYHARTPYGIPRYIGNLLSILGGRCAEEVNYATFRNNQIPSMMVLVSGGALTEETIDRLSEFSENVIQGDDNRSRFLIVEAEPDPSVDNLAPGSTGGAANVRVDVKSLREVVHEDAMFIEYEKNNADKVRRSWRLPPIVLGSSDDYSRATSDTARKLAEEQIFEPERREEDWEWNRTLRAMGMQRHFFKLSSPNVTNDEDLIQVMAIAEKSGAMTPRLGSKLMGDILGFPVPSADESEVPPDVPFSLTMAEKVKNLAKPNEVGQQVTALKSVDQSTDTRVQIPIKKFDGEKRLVYGIVLEPDIVDAHNEWERAETIEKTAHAFLAKYNSETQVGIQHILFGDIGVELVESYIAQQDMDFDGELGPEDMIRKGSWVVAVKVHSDDIWQKVKDGTITGFSVRGVATILA